MRQKFYIAAFCVLIAAALVSAAGCGGEPGAENISAVAAMASAEGATDLSGTWVLNRELSDKPVRPDSAGGWRGRGDRPDSARFARFRERIQDGEFPDSLRGPRQGRGPRGPVQMTIEQTDSTVTFTGLRGHSRTLFTDGRVMAPQNDRAPEGAEVRAIWNDDGHLVVSHSGPRGGSRIETFGLSETGNQLIVVTESTGPDGDRNRRFRRVYDSAPAGE